MPKRPQTVCDYSYEDKEIICYESERQLAIRIKNYYLVWDTVDLSCYQIDSIQFAGLRSMVNVYCATLEDFLITASSYSSFIKTALADDFLSKVFKPSGEKLFMHYKIEYPVEDPSITVIIYYHSEKYIEDYNNWYIQINREGGYEYWDFEITPDNKISHMAPFHYVDFYSHRPETQSVNVLPDKCRELLKSFIDSGAYKYMLHQNVDLNNYKPNSHLPKVIPEKNDETNLFG